MMKNVKFTAYALALCMAASSLLTGPVHAASDSSFKDVVYSGISVNDGEVIKGVDISSVISLENSGVKFRDKNGNEQDIFLTLRQSGVNYIRVRIWNDPYDGQGRTYGGGNCDIENAVKIAQRCSRYGLKLLLDFHYSDFWADPGKQVVPKAWRYFSVDQKEQAVREFTYSSLEKIAAAGAEIGMVQVGNETNSGMAGETDWKNVCRLMNAASSAVRQFDKEILVAVHFTNPEKQNLQMTFAGYLSRNSVDYDVFATSYYPYWHGTLSNLTSVLRQISSSYGKYVMVAETSWANTFNDADGFANTIGSRNDLGNYVSYDISTSGQIRALTDVFSAVAAVGPKGIGVFYWEPAWLGVGKSQQECYPLWEQYGSGWASQAAGEYQEDAKKYHGGSAVDNQALFSSDGIPLESLEVFSHIRADGELPADLKNLLSNGGYEADRKSTDNPSGWTLYGTTGGEYSKFTVNDEMPLAGSYSLHWYSPYEFSGSTAAASVKAEKTGSYSFKILAAGEKSTVTSEVYINGKKTTSQTGQVYAYDKTEEIECSFDASEGDSINVVVSVSGSNESYGSVDECILYCTGESSGNSTNEITGDINADGKCSAADLLVLRSYMLGSADLSDDEYRRSDISSDGKVSLDDYILLKNLLLY